MNLQDTILEIRKNNGLTQEEFAEKLFVTRQAVSRWENGETTPAIDTLKAISGLFWVDANTLLGTGNPVCQSCAMPLKSLDDIAANADKGANTDYCRYCFDGGKFTNDVSVGEMIETNLKYLSHFNAEAGTDFSEEEARKILTQYLPTLKRWNNAER